MFAAKREAGAQQQQMQAAQQAKIESLQAQLADARRREETLAKSLLSQSAATSGRKSRGGGGGGGEEGGGGVGGKLDERSERAEEGAQLEEMRKEHGRLGGQLEAAQEKIRELSDLAHELELAMDAQRFEFDGR
jgi:hypothetical protein